MWNKKDGVFRRIHHADLKLKEQKKSPALPRFSLLEKSNK